MGREFVKGVTLSRYVASAYVQIGNLKSASNIGTGARDYIDVTSQDSDAKEYAPGLEDGGEKSCVVWVDDTNRPLINDLFTSFDGGTLEKFKVEWPGIRSIEFYAYAEVELPVDVNKYFDVTIKLKQSGKKTFTDLS